ncbi:class I SAM-dependent methyltransferase [Winogradskyella sp. A3E31]|uniref:class I SAM-dependent methyltransferase n=1 Tax=Winogradskyella sp. A3E31 TaxID=3349637 RepID=UPI00398B302E
MFGTDKAIDHFYLPHYKKHFRPYKFKKINLLEIGVGGYKSPKHGGHSLRLWKSYFPFAHIFAIDIYDKSALEEKRIKIYKGSQVDIDFLNKISSEIGDFDIIIDDGSHVNEHVIKSFQLLFPKLKDGGIYVVEDTQTSYWKRYGGDSIDLKNSNTIMNFFKNLTDSLNHKEFLLPGYEPTYFDKHITAINFYHNLIFIYKGFNDEPSNVLLNNDYVKV